MSDLPEEQDANEDEGHAAPEDWMMPARQEGHEWADIAQHVAGASADATAEGHTTADIDKFLGYADQGGANDRMQSGWGAKFAEDENLLGTVSQGALNLSHDATRSDYARALKDNEVKGADDFSYSYASAALSAAHGRGGLPEGDDDEVRRKQRQAAAAADGLGATLPDRADFVDAALSLTDDPEHAKRVQQNLVDNWRDTGQHPADAAKKAKTDPELGAALNAFTPASDADKWSLSHIAGIVGNFALNTGAELASFGGIPNSLGQVGDQVLGMLGAGQEPGWFTRHTYSGDELKNNFWKGAQSLAEITGSKLERPEQGPLEQFLSTLTANTMGFLTGTGEVNLAAQLAKGAAAGLTFTGLTKAHDALRPDASPLEQLAFGLLAGGLAHNAGRGAVRMWSPQNDGPGMRDVALAEAAHDPLYHAEAQEMALDPNFSGKAKTEEQVRGAADKLANGPGSVTSEDNQTARPSFKLVEPELKAGEVAPAAGEAKRFEVHQNGEPVGSMRVSFPEEAQGKSAFVDSMTAGKLGEKNPIGPRAIRDLATQFFETHPNVDTIDGLHVSGARRAAGDDRGSVISVTRDQVMKQRAPAEVQEMAAGYHQAGAMAGFMHNVGALVNDQSGALKLGNMRLFGKEPTKAAIDDMSKQGQRTFYDAFISMQGNARRSQRVFNRGLEDLKAHPWFNKHMDEWNAELDKGPAGNPRGTEIGQFYQMMQGKIPMDPNHQMAPVMNLWREWANNAHARMVDWDQRGIVDAPNFIKDYYGQRWKDPNAVYARLQGAGIFGNSTAWKARRFDSIMDGLDHGFEPLNRHPVDDMLHQIGTFERKAAQIEALEMVKGMPGSQAGYKDRAALGEVRLDGVGLVGGKGFYAPEGFARPWNNAVSRGMLDNPLSADMRNNMMYAINMVNAIKLILPTFHLRTVLLGSYAGGIAQAMEEFGRSAYNGAFKGEYKIAGDQFQRAMQTLGTLPARPFLDYARGRDAMNTYEKNLTHSANSTGVVDLLTEAGFSAGRGTFEFTSRAPDLYTSIKHHWDTNEGALTNSGRIVSKAFNTQMDRLVKDFGAGTDESLARRAGMLMPRVGTHLVDEAGRLATTFTAPAFQHIIPRMEMGSAAERLQSWLAANPHASYEAQLSKARQYRSDIENRLGELNMLNVFWPKMAKQMAALTMLSVGWKYGTWRGVAQAAGINFDEKRFEWNPVAFTSTLGTAISWAGMNSLWQYMSTGTVPWNTDTMWKDFALYRTGGTPFTSRDGRSIQRRGMIPGEPKEIYDMAHVLFTAMGNPSQMGPALTEYAMNATNPLWQVLHGYITDEDAVGHHIGEYPGGWQRFLKEEFSPIFATSASTLKSGAGIPMWEQKWFGTREAAKWAEDPKSYEDFLEYQKSKWEKDELKRAKKEAAGLEDPSELNAYIEEKEAQMRAAGGGAAYVAAYKGQSSKGARSKKR